MVRYTTITTSTNSEANDSEKTGSPASYIIFVCQCSAISAILSYPIRSDSISKDRNMSSTVLYLLQTCIQMILWVCTTLCVRVCWCRGHSSIFTIGACWWKLCHSLWTRHKRYIFTIQESRICWGILCQQSPAQYIRTHLIVYPLPKRGYKRYFSILFSLSIFIFNLSLKTTRKKKHVFRKFHTKLKTSRILNMIIYSYYFVNFYL